MEWVKDREVLNAFSYTGGFSMAALQGGSTKVVSLDASKAAVEQSVHHASINGFEDRHEGVCGDVLQYLKSVDLLPPVVILDPPAYAKSRNARHKAVQGYKRLNETGFEKDAFKQSALDLQLLASGGTPSSSKTRWWLRPFLQGVRSESCADWVSLLITQPWLGTKKHATSKGWCCTWAESRLKPLNGPRVLAFFKAHPVVQAPWSTLPETLALQSTVDILPSAEAWAHRQENGTPPPFVLTPNPTCRSKSDFGPMSTPRFDWPLDGIENTGRFHFRPTAQSGHEREAVFPVLARKM